MWSSPSRWTASAATRKTPRDSSNASLRRRQHRHVGRGRHYASAHRIQGHDERPIPQRSRREDSPRPARANRGRKVRRRSLLRLSRRQGSQRRRGHDRRTGNRIGRGRYRRTDVPRVRCGRVAEANREEPESRGCARSVRWSLESEHDLRQCQAWNRDPQQRALRRPPGLESPSLCEEP